MRAVVQRVTEASVRVDGEVVGQIGKGYLALLCAEQGDAESDAQYMADKLANVRIFEDQDGKMNRSILEEGGEILLVSQFTLAGDARHGRRPSFSAAARPDAAVPLLGRVRDALTASGIRVAEGRFQADMKVSLTNDGPVTILLDSRKTF